MIQLKDDSEDRTMKLTSYIALLLGLALTIINIALGLDKVYAMFTGIVHHSEVVPLGFTPHGIDKDPEALKNRYTKEFIEKANSHVAVCGKIEFAPDIPGETYDAYVRHLLWATLTPDSCRRSTICFIDMVNLQIKSRASLE